jgi:uncharacterized protein YceK
MKMLAAYILVVFTLSGCGTYVTVMEHPETEDVQKCEAWGVGLIPKSMAEDQHDKCVKQLRSLGYEPAGN